ncbi:MAG: tRNA pseudouridine(55) synthase TruB [Clostridia bacterium]|nr:tRNA pseudouridine(55) synthase TruB [Clostridia bacterium]
MTNLTGFVNIVKPTGMSSSDVVCKVKKILKTKKVGHLGTLDPAASGVLPVAVGRATKFFDYFLTKDKEYVAIVKFGIETDSLDSFGNITNTNAKNIEESEILRVLPKFIGKISQVPPKYSAIKINGKRACDLARVDASFEIKPRQIEIFDIKLLKNLDDNVFLFKVHCSAGTYIRTLFSDIAYALETVSTTTAIIRTKSGRFFIEDAVTLEELEKTETVQAVESVFSDFETIEIADDLAKKVLNGVKVKVSDFPVLKEPKGEFFISYKNKTIGFYKIKDERLEAIAYLNEN